MNRVERIEENEKLFREVNERVAQMQGGLGSDPDPEWICECGDETCFEKLSIRSPSTTKSGGTTTGS